MRCEIAVHLRVEYSKGAVELLKKNRFAIYLKNLQTEKLTPLRDKTFNLLGNNDHFEILCLYNGTACLEDMGLSQKALQRNIACKSIECITFEK